jgi:hypothetical protein
MKKIELLPFHPVANLFPLMTGKEFDELVADIRRNGLEFPIATFDGKIIDGRNRALACQRAHQNLFYEEYTSFHFPDEAALRAFIISANIHRRHLTPEQRRELIAKLLKADPGKSNRQIAETVKADHKTVGAVRQEQEARGEIPHVEKRIDTKGREQPASKPALNPPRSDVPHQADASAKVQITPSRKMRKAAWQHLLGVAPDITALRDFATFTIANVLKGKLKMEGSDPETLRKWHDLKTRVESVLAELAA